MNKILFFVCKSMIKINQKSGKILHLTALDIAFLDSKVE